MKRAAAWKLATPARFRSWEASPLEGLFSLDTVSDRGQLCPVESLVKANKTNPPEKHLVKRGGRRQVFTVCRDRRDML